MSKRQPSSSLSSSRTEEFLNVIINSLPGGILIIDDDDRIKRANLSALEMLGVGEMEGLKLKEVLPYQEIVEKIKSAEERDEFELTIHKERQETHLHFNISFAKEAEPSGIVKRYRILLISDITEGVELERLKYHQKINSDFLSGISHHLRTPLTSIIGLSQIIKGNESVPENARKGIEVIYTQALRMRELVDDLIDFAILNRTKALHIKEEIELSELLKSVISDFKFKNIYLGSDHKKHYITSNRKWLYRTFKQLFELGMKDKDSRADITIKETDGLIDLFICGLSNLIPELSAIKNMPMLQFDDPLTGSADLTHLNLSLIRLILSYHNVKIKLDKENDIVLFAFNPPIPVG